MAHSLTDDQLAIRDGACDFLAAEAGFERLRATIDGDAGWDAGLWRAFAGEMGFAGLGIDGMFGGSGLGAFELALVAEELGRVLAPIPWFESAVLAAQAIDAAGDDAQKARWLGSIARGETVATLAMHHANGGAMPAGTGPVLTRVASGWRLRGEAHYVPFGHIADVVIVAARLEAGGGWDGIGLVALDASTASIEKRVSLDLTRPLAHLRFDDVAVPQDAVLAGGGQALRRALAAASAILAAEQVGGMQRSLDETVDYAKQRVQFGRPIGSFQVIKHRLADMKLRLEAARSAAGWAIEAIDGPEMFTASAAARAYCSDAYLAIAGDAIQLHGGIGFTWEHHAHLFFKRARSSATMLDDARHHRAEIARVVIDEAA